MDRINIVNLSFCFKNVLIVRGVLFNSFVYLVCKFWIYFKGFRSVKSISFLKWHNEMAYFSGYYNNRKIFLKCEVGFKKTLKNEYDIYKKLSSNPRNKVFLLELIDAFNFPIFYCIAYEFIDAPTSDIFFELKKTSNESVISAETLINQFIYIIDQLYEAKILHRDLRPQNIFVYNNNLKLFDFAYSICLNKPEKPKLDLNLASALGEHYKPENYKWDDAYSVLILLDESGIDIPLGLKIEIDQRINRLSFSV